MADHKSVRGQYEGNMISDAGFELQRMNTSPEYGSRRHQGSKRGQLDPNDSVAFSAGQSQHDDSSELHTIPFKQVITVHNIGKGLNYGRFTCDIPGRYKVQVYSLTQYDSKIFLNLNVNNKLIFCLWGHTPLSYAAAGNAAILELCKGDIVKVVARKGYRVRLYGAPREIYTTFTSILPVKSGRKLASFSVCLANNQTVEAGQSVLFDNVILDTDKSYARAHGVYTAPTAGVYVFHFFSLAKLSREVWLELYQNGNYVCSIYAKVVFAWVSAGNTVILHLDSNDEVTIKARSNSSIYGRIDEIYSTFSGSLLMTDETSVQQASTGHRIAFSAGLSSGYTVDDSKIVAFNRVFVNSNHAYNFKTGEFTVPVAGLYEFNYHALAQYDTSLWLELFHNDKYVNSLYSRSPIKYATAGNAAVIAAEAGDVITVRAHNKNKLYGEADEVYCTFSGYLLEPN